MPLRITHQPPQEPWTPDQWHAIHTRGAHLLVAAAAGAGKTAVLVERIIRRILDPQEGCDVDRLLVVTFTDAAAAQMRERIAKALVQAAEDPGRPPAERARLRRQAALLDRASIQTLHGFCLWLVRRYFYLLDIDPLFRVLDEEEAALLKFETVDRLLEQEYDRAMPGDPFHALVEALRSARGDDAVRSTVLALHAYASSLPDPDAWFARAEGMYDIPDGGTVDDLPWTPLLRAALTERLQAAQAFLRQALAAAEAAGAPATAPAILRKELGYFAELEEAARTETWADLYRRFTAEVKWDRMNLAGKVDELQKERISKARDGAKGLLKEIREKFFAYDPDTALRLVRESAPYARELIRLVRRFDALYGQAKRSRAAADFSDLERMALAVLTHEPEEGGSSPCEELRAHFVEVLVDEYQDINPLQDAILRKVSRPADAEDPNLFMVGDVKQSIYRFRLADPSLFMERMATFQPLAEALRAPADAALPGVVIDLKANFRSRPQVIDGVNFVFRQILTPGVGELRYDERAELVAQASYPPAPEHGIELHIVQSSAESVPAGGAEGGTDGGGEGEAGEDAADAGTAAQAAPLEAEAAVVAELVARMLERGDPVSDGAGGLRPVRPGDIAILLRSTKGRANAYVEALRARGIPAYAELGTGFFWAVEIETMLSVLRIIDNPRQDIPLAAVLRAPWVDLTTAELARVRTLQPAGDLYDAVLKGAVELQDGLGERLRRFVGQLDRWRTAARRSTLGELIQRIYIETGYPEYVQGMPGGAQRLVNLNALHERAQRFDGFTQGGLPRFLRFVDSLQEEDGDLGEAPLLGEGDDVVRIMSIHKSKGLQFPVVIVANLGKGHNLSDAADKVVYHGTLGIAAEWTDPGRGLRSPTLAHLAVAEARRRDALAEELRVLYVALTRAQERLILVGAVKDPWQAADRWSQAADVAGWALPDHLLARAKSPLTWLGMAVMRHADGAPLREAAGREGAGAVHPRDPAVFADPSRWCVKIWTLEEVAGLLPARASAPDAAARDLHRLAAGEPVGQAVDPALAEALERRFGHRYPHAASTRLPAKVSVTLLAREMFRAHGDEAAPLPPRGRADDVEPFAPRLRRPAFAAAVAAPAPAEIGTAMHTLLYHLDLAAEPDAEAVRRTGRSLVDRRLIGAAAWQALNVEAVVRFLRSDLGRRLRLAAREGRLWREWAFTLAVESSAAAEWLAAGAAGECPPGDHVIVQGTVDALWLEGDGLYLLDYKTDRVADAAQLLPRYAPQVRLYAVAVERITGLRPAGAYLVHLSGAGAALPVAL